jgi:hypothetical protein
MFKNIIVGSSEKEIQKILDEQKAEHLQDIDYIGLVGPMTTVTYYISDYIGNEITIKCTEEIVVAILHKSKPLSKKLSNQSLKGSGQ